MMSKAETLELLLEIETIIHEIKDMFDEAMDRRIEIDRLESLSKAA